MRYSVIIPVYNRPDEVDELLQSLTQQSFKDFEVIVVEDGSSIPCKPVTEKYQELLDVHYYDKPNSGPGQTRNYGVERSKGEYLIILDSDCILPEGYFLAVEEELQHEAADAFGGPDRAHESFTNIQKAINYSMTSFFTTGGIRGGKKKMDKFYPRSFNMGVRQEVYQALGGHRLQHPNLQGRIYMPAVPRCLGIPQATDRLPKILQAGTQFRDCPHQSVQEVSGIAEARPPAAGCIYPGSGHIPAGNALLPVQPAAHRSLCASGMHGLHYPEP